MSTKPADLRALLIAHATRDESPYALTHAQVGAQTFTVFRHGPRSLRDVYAASLRFSDRTFLVYEGERYTFPEAWQRASAIAQHLLGRGVCKGDRVARVLEQPRGDVQDAARRLHLHRRHRQARR